MIIDTPMSNRITSGTRTVDVDVRLFSSVFDFWVFDSTVQAAQRSVRFLDITLRQVELEG